jgi:pimeloyl-ACP methyl ester carboxylesterase
MAPSSTPRAGPASSPSSRRPEWTWWRRRTCCAASASTPELDDLERRLAAFPAITVPTITLEGDANGAPHPEPATYATRFTGKYLHRTLTGGIGHNLPQEAPLGFVAAIEEADSFA